MKTEGHSEGLLLATAREACQQLASQPSLENLDDFLFCATVLARSEEAPGDSFEAIFTDLAGGSPWQQAWHHSAELPSLVASWYQEIGLPLFERGLESLGTLPLRDFVLGIEPEEEAEQRTTAEARQLWIAILQHRDLLEAATTASPPTDFASDDEYCRRLAAADERLQSRLLRSLFLNDLRQVVTQDLRGSLRRSLWWWSELAEIAPATLAQLAEGEIDHASVTSDRLAFYMRRDPELERFIEERAAALQILRETGSETAPEAAPSSPLPFRLRHRSESRRSPAGLRVYVQRPPLAAASLDRRLEQIAPDIYTVQLSSQPAARLASIQLWIQPGRVRARFNGGHRLRLIGTGAPLAESWIEVGATPTTTAASLIESTFEWIN